MEAVRTFINREQCIACGACIKHCPAGTLSIVEEKASVTGTMCWACGHCEASCPVSAITVESLKEDTLALSNLPPQKLSYLKPGADDTAKLVSLMRSRRSCRHYQDKPVDPSLLSDLVKIGATAPSGTNNQRWTFTILPDRNSVEEILKKVADYYKKLNSLSEKAIARFWAKLFMKDALGQYYRSYHDLVAMALEEYEKTGRDRIFHGAPAVIFVGSKPGGSTPFEDALLASQNILLAAHSLGLGSCLVGFAVEAIRRDEALRNALSLEPGERIHTAIALGYPNEIYQRMTGRKQAHVRIYKKPE